jgi:hypothetical protein
MASKDLENQAELENEAQRLALLPLDVQRQALAIIREPAGNPKVARADRLAAKRRADALERHLRRLNRRKNK